MFDPDTFLRTTRNFSLYLLELSTTTFLLYEWTIGPDDVISEFLYRDKFQRSILSFFILVHLSVIFWDLHEHSTTPAILSKFGVITAATAWIILITNNNHTGTTVHNYGVVSFVVACTGTMFCVSLLQQRAAVRFIMWFLLGIGTVFSIEYLHLFFTNSRDTWLTQHRAFLTMMIGFTLLVHNPPILENLHHTLEQQGSASTTRVWIQAYGSMDSGALCPKAAFAGQGTLDRKKSGECRHCRLLVIAYLKRFQRF